jgi:hypothetical protein
VIPSPYPQEHVDILTEGFAFRLLFHSGRDEAMLAKAEAEFTSTSGPRVASGGQPRHHDHALLHRNALVRSWHHGLISAAMGVNPAVAPAARLARRWVEAQVGGCHTAHPVVKNLGQGLDTPLLPCSHLHVMEADHFVPFSEAIMSITDNVSGAYQGFPFQMFPHKYPLSDAPESSP